MTPVNLNEFLIRHPAILNLRLQVDEAAVAVKHAHVAGLRALSDKNAPLISRWHEYFRECHHGHQIFIGTFYREMTALLNVGIDTVQTVNREMLHRKLELDQCMIAIEKAEHGCDHAFHSKNSPLLMRWHERFENCRERYLHLLTAFRRDFLGLPPSVM